jgi:hypothetical protein
MAAFVTARLDEDVAVAAGYDVDGKHGCCCGRCAPGLARYLDRWCNARVFREVAAHRRILARYNAAAERYAAERKDDLLAERRMAALALADVAGVWAEHPHFQAQWAHFAALDEDAPARPIPNMPLFDPPNRLLAPVF